MSEEIRIAEEGKRFYTLMQIMIATFVFGPLAGGYLISRNFRIFGNAKAGRLSLFLAVAYSILLSRFTMAMPESMHEIIGTLFAMANLTFAYSIVERCQRRGIDGLLLAGYVRASSWKVLLIGILGFVVVVILCILLSSLSHILPLENGAEAGHNSGLAI